MLRLKAALDERNEQRRGPDPTLVLGLRLDADEADFRATYVKFSKRTPPSSELAGCDDKRPLLNAALFAAGTVTSSRSRTRACGLCTGMLVNSASNWLVSRLPCAVAGMSASDLTKRQYPKPYRNIGLPWRLHLALVQSRPVDEGEERMLFHLFCIALPTAQSFKRVAGQQLQSTG